MFGFTEFFRTDIFWEITYFQKYSSSRPPVLNSPNWPRWLKKSYVTKHGVQPPWLKNVMSLTRGPNWPTWLKKRYVTNTGPQPISMIKKKGRHQHGAPANLHDKKNVTSPTWGPNWPFRCLDVVNIYKPLHFPSACACFCCSTVFLRNVGHKLMSQGQTTKCSLYSDEILWKVGATCYPHDFHKSEKRKQW